MGELTLEQVEAALRKIIEKFDATGAAIDKVKLEDSRDNYYAMMLAVEEHKKSVTEAKTLLGITTESAG